MKNDLHEWVEIIRPDPSYFYDEMDGSMRDSPYWKCRKCGWRVTCKKPRPDFQYNCNKMMSRPGSGLLTCSETAIYFVCET